MILGCRATWLAPWLDQLSKVQLRLELTQYNETVVRRNLPGVKHCTAPVVSQFDECRNTRCGRGNPETARRGSGAREVHADDGLIGSDAAFHKRTVLRWKNLGQRGIRECACGRSRLNGHWRG